MDRQKQSAPGAGKLIGVALVAFVVGRATSNTTASPAPIYTPSPVVEATPTDFTGPAAQPSGDQTTATTASYDVVAPQHFAAQSIEPAAADETDVYYRNCSVARAAGAAPIREGEPGYAPHLDRDGDGVACE